MEAPIPHRTRAPTSPRATLQLPFRGVQRLYTTKLFWIDEAINVDRLTRELKLLPLMLDPLFREGRVIYCELSFPEGLPPRICLR